MAYQRALHFLNYRARSEAEIQRKLTEQGFDDAVVAATIQRLKDNKFLGDEQFARDWVENRSTFRPRSKRMLAMELRQKGVAEEEIQRALDETGDESSLAYESAIRYARKLAGSDWETFRKRLGAYLMRRGFSYGTIAPILRQVWDELHAEDEADAPDSDSGDNLTHDEENGL